MSATNATVHARQRGFTLLEVMAAIAVFLIGVVGVIGLLTSGTRLHQESQNLVITNDVAEEVLLLSQRAIAERVKHASDPLPEAPPPAPVPSRPELKYAWRLTAAPDESLFLLAVDVSWLENGQPHKTTFERVLPRLMSADVEARALLGGGAGGGGGARGGG
jgi:prepilin-type N-terminal cleavage/methylation domain-containing protein